MAVNIQIKGSTETSEFKDATALKKRFQSYFKDYHNGEILIIPSATLFGQEVTDIDMVVMGKLDKFCLQDRATKIYDPISKQTLNDNSPKNVFINSFCSVIEIKGHRAESLTLDGQTIFVKYGSKKKDVTTQSEKQKYSLKNFLEEHTKTNPQISNFIWFNNVSKESLNNLTSGDEVNNYLHSDFTINEFFDKVIIQKAPKCFFDKDLNKYKKNASYDSFFTKNNEIDFAGISKAFDLFTRNKKGMGTLTRQKLERFNSKLFKEQQYAKDLGEKMLIFSGKAGTGKTTKLLNAAFDLATNHSMRCLILTYNHALVSDIKRIIAFQGFSSDIDESTVQISTLHKFFRDVLIGFGLGQRQIDSGKKEIDLFLNDKIYYKLLNELVELIDEGLVDEDEISNLLKSNYDTIDYDYVLVDECQDWDEREKLVLYKIFGFQKIILAEGADQLVRTSKKCNWVYQMRPKRDFNKTNEKFSLRQKKGLVRFVNAYAQKVGLNWELEPKAELNGGNIIIMNTPYNKTINNQLVQDLKINDYAAYDMMFFTPPCNVGSKLDERNRSSRYFTKAKEFEELGILLWDGTDFNFRSKSQYPVDPDHHRIFQYDSCRGLEGWSIICLDFDEFVKYKMETFVDTTSEIGTGDLGLETPEQKRDRYVYLWSLIPLTRAIDTLVITIKYPNGHMAQLLKEIYLENQDIVQWVD